MRFQVPQFTEVEDRIVGPLTLKQFIYIAGAVGICIVLFTFLPKFLAFPLMLPVLLLGAALAFYKVNNRPFIRVVEASVKYFLGSKLYIWRHEEKSPTAREENRSAPVAVPKLSQSKLRDLTWSLDVKQDISSRGALEELPGISVNEGRIGQ